MSDADLDEARALMHNELISFMGKLYAKLHADKLLVTQDVPALDEYYDLEKLNDVNDRIIVMQYDQHTPSAEPGPLAGQRWIEQSAEKDFEKLDPEKTIIGVGNFCYDWAVTLDADDNVVKYETARELPLGTALSIARQAGSEIEMDDDDLNPYFFYKDSKTGQSHLVYMLDAVSAFNQIQALRGYEAHGAALWYLGEEDPAIWSFLGDDKLNQTANPKLLEQVNFKNVINADVDPGDGELTQITSLTRPGIRSFDFDEDGLITDETYASYPSPYTIKQFDGAGKTIALTFDDGPDPGYTPQILRILKQNGVHATFFVLGEKAAQYPNVIRQAYLEGNELGNHTYSHPHIETIASWNADMQINATERVLEGITGHGTLLFRPPYGDLPDSSQAGKKDIVLFTLMEHYGFINVGMNLDPKDYTRPSPAAMIDSLDQQLQKDPSAHIVLLHDGGGNRENTVAALPQMIAHLRAEGYTFVTLSELMGPEWHDKLFPAATGREAQIAAFDLISFEVWYGIGDIFRWLFLAVMVLGVLRLVVFTPLAIRQRPAQQAPGATDVSSAVDGCYPGV